MKACPDCVPCLLKRILFQSRLIGDANEYRTMQSAMDVYSSDFAKGGCSAEISTRVHKTAYASMECDDPYLQLKLDADKVAEEFVPAAQAYVDSAEDRFAAAVRVCIVGNIMDFGSGIAIDDPSQFRGMFSSLLAQGIGHDETDRLRELVDSSDTVLYAFDNCGEDQLDIILIRELKSMGKRVVGVVRGKPILNDVAMGDALRVGLDRECDRLVSTGAFAVGFPRQVCDDGLAEELPRAGLLIAKGMANYESLSEMYFGVPVAFLLRAKCLPVARSLGVDLNTNVVHVQMKLSE